MLLRRRVLRWILVLRLSLVLLWIKVRRGTGMRRRAGMLARRMRCRTRRDRLMMLLRRRRMLLRTAFVEPVFISVIGVRSLILAARIARVILRRGRERTESVIGPGSVVVRLARIHAVACTRTVAVGRGRVPTRLSR